MIMYYVISIPGLEKIACKEIQKKFGDLPLTAEKIGRIVFPYDGNPTDLFSLRSVEDVFILIREIKGLSRSRNSLGKIYKAVIASDFEMASRVHKQAHKSKAKKKLTFKVTSSMSGRHNFRRVDAQKAVESALINKYGWKLQLEDPILEIRIDLEDDKGLIGLRLSDETMSNRSYKIFHLPASLKPTVAYCMALLSEPKPGDVFVDPMCGAGTIPIERAFAGAYKIIISADLEEGIVHSARGNIEESLKNISTVIWDVSHIPLKNRSVDKLVTNLPFGNKIGTKAENRALYTGFFREMARITKPGGKGVLLTTENKLVKELISEYPSMVLKRQLKIDLLGIKAYIYVINIRQSSIL